MLATFMIEIVLAIWIVLRYRLTAVTRLCVVILICLATFQLAEYNVCEGSWGLSSLTWARVGYVAITLLPPLGLHLATRIAGKRNHRMLAASYAIAVVFGGYFMLSEQGLGAQACLGNYVIFEINPWASKLHALYYYSLLLAGVAYSLHYAGSARPHIARALKSLSFGYAAFMLPTTLINIIDPSTMTGIPSIMCGFAVIFVVVIAGDMLPAYHKWPAGSGVAWIKKAFMARG